MKGVGYPFTGLLINLAVCHYVNMTVITGLAGCTGNTLHRASWPACEGHLVGLHRRRHKLLVLHIHTGACLSLVLLFGVNSNYKA